MLLYAHSLEVHTEFATLYLRGMLRGPDVAVARATCARLPRAIRLLRLDLHGMDAVDAAARQGITSLVRDWRRDRLGHVIIAAASEDLSALAAAEPENICVPDLDFAEPALMATYL